MGINTDKMDVDVLADGLLEEVMAEAEAMSEAMQTFSQFGRLTYGAPRFIKFEDGAAIDVTKQEWLDLGKRGKMCEWFINVDIQEFNPSLDFSYERKVGVNSNDWFKHWRQSIIDVFELEAQVDPELKGKEKAAALNRLFNAAFKSLNGKYVEASDVPQEPRKNATPTDKIYRTPELRAVFESRADCVAAITERFGTAPAGVAAVQQDAPEGFASHAEFADTVATLRASGKSNAEVSRDLGVSVAAVAHVK